MGRAFEFRKARKMKRWGKMAVTFTRIGKEIAMAVKQAGPDPTNNARLRVAVQNAKAENMPKDRVDAAISSEPNAAAANGGVGRGRGGRTRSLLSSALKGIGSR